MEYLKRLIKKCIYKKTEEKKKHVLKVINQYNENKKQELKVISIISQNITLAKNNLLPSFSEGYMQDLLNDLEYLNNLLKEYKYKKNESKKMENTILKNI